MVDEQNKFICKKDLHMSEKSAKFALDFEKNESTNG
jgi:hypothetical protein